MHDQSIYELDDTGERSKIVEASKHLLEFIDYFKITESEAHAKKSLNALGAALLEIGEGDLDDTVVVAVKNAMAKIKPSRKELEDYHSLKRVDRFIREKGLDQDEPIMTKAAIIKSEIKAVEYMKAKEGIRTKDVVAYLNSQYGSYLENHKMTRFTSNDIDQVLFKLKRT